MLQAPTPPQELRVLLLEDRADDARLIGYELEQSGFQCTVDRATNEAEYRAKLSPAPDVILADYTLPTFGARGALLVLKELDLDIPLIVVTGTIAEDTAVEVMHLGAADYLLKDRLARLGPAMGRALLEKQARDAKRRAEEALHELLRFEQMLRTFSTRLIQARPSELDRELTAILGAVAEFHGCEQIVVRAHQPETGAFTLTHWWSAADTSLAKPEPVINASDFSEPSREVLKGTPLLVVQSTVARDHPELRQLMKAKGLEVFGALALRVQSEPIGLLALHWRRRPAQVAEGFMDRLNLVADMVAGTLARLRAEREREEAFQELERLKQAAEQERDYLREELRHSDASTIVGEAGALRAVLELVDAVAPTRATVLICGESGSGKEVIARAIHERSDRAEGPLVKVNCASIPKELFESEFFGHVKGSFTGAVRNRSGRFELADGGTLFLDEVGEIPMEMQSKLLRVLQESEFERVGDDRTKRVDVRIVAATNRDLDTDVQAGTFRRDLFYRLNVFPIFVPPLRDRREDIVKLAEFFLRRACAELRRPGLAILPEHRQLLEAYDWPGNVRELQHVMERAVILSPVPPLRLDLALSVPSASARRGLCTHGPGAILTEAELRSLERDNILAALDRAGYRISGSGGAAVLLGLSPSTLRDRMKSLNIQRTET